MISTLENQPAGSGVDLVADTKAIFSESGLLSRSKDFEYRPQQQEMAVAVARALAENRHLVVEAGTGVGKSLAYLIPAIQHAVHHRKKAVVCTHTINLQEQLIEKDLPVLKKILPVEFRYTMLKGRQNYLCTRRLHKAMQNAEGLFTSPEARELQYIYEWSQTTRNGSLSDFDHEPTPKVWQQVCSERGLCSPKKCGSQSDFAKDHGTCFFQRARQRILASDVLVLNHTLFFLLLAGVDEENRDGLLFRNDFVIFDEAHCVESIAARHIGISVSNGQFRYALQRLWNPRTEKGLLAILREGASIPMVADLLEKSQDFFTELEAACDALFRRHSGPAGAGNRRWSEFRVRRPDVVEDSLTLPIQRLRDRIRELVAVTNDKDNAEELRDCNARLLELSNAVALFLSQAQEKTVYWVERSGKQQTLISLNAAPVDVSAFLRRRLFGANTSVIMTSATLSIRDPARTPPGAQRHGGGLGYFTSRVGAKEETALQVGSPFDFRRQMKLHVVGKMPDPRDSGYEDALAFWIEHYLRLSHGKAFVLFTNNRLMQNLADRMDPFFHELGIDCYVQGRGMPRSAMLERFKENTQSVLMGNASFWQGVDVPGESLSNVIITRLPFAVPDHPLIEARVEFIESLGGNAFKDFSLPEAILKFRQGVGRLIRSRKDTGIIVVLDNRILTKRYGRDFLNALPEVPVEID